MDLYAILYLVTDKAAALLVAMYAHDGRGTRGDGQAAMNQPEEKYLRVTNEAINALQAALAATSSMESDEDPDHYIMKATHIRNRLAAVKEHVTDRHFTDIIVQGLPESYRDIKLTTYKDPDFDLGKIQATMRHLYLDLEQDQEDCWSWHGHDSSIRHQFYRHLPQLREGGPLQDLSAAALCLARCSERARSLLLLLLETRRLEEVELGKSGAQCTRPPPTTTRNATLKGLSAPRRQVARTRLLF